MTLKTLIKKARPKRLHPHRTKTSEQADSSDFSAEPKRKKRRPKPSGKPMNSGADKKLSEKSENKNARKFNKKPEQKANRSASGKPKPPTPKMHKGATLKGLVKLNAVPSRSGRPASGELFFIPIQKELQSVRFSILNPPAGLADGNIVRVEVGNRGASHTTPVRVLEVLSPSFAGLESRLVAEAFEIPSEFPAEVLADAAKLPARLSPSELAEREDLRQTPLVTIDGEDAKDFDDAVWAEKTPDGDFHLIVAIADVAHYIQPGSPLDLEALNRGNSSYFPDLVIPMLPERISNNLCSLVPQEDRPTLVCHMWINAQGKLLKHKFTRGVIHSAARLTYTEVQQALDGNPNAKTKPLLKGTILPLFEAYQALTRFRDQRGALDLDLPESHMVTNEKGEITALEPRLRLDSHKLIEEMMILANVAAATTLQTKGSAALYRIHDAPTPEKIENLNQIFKNHNLPNKLKQSPEPLHIQRIINGLRGHASAPVLMQSVLQSQQRASYDPQNIGHFGLALQRYAHFTSPIRRYSDLIVHRSLVHCLKLPGAGASIVPVKKLESVAEHINKTERRSQQAEWDVRDKMTARFYQDFLGKEFKATVLSVLSFGVFVQIENGLAEGLVPLRLMQNDHFILDEKKQQLRGKKTKQIIQVGSSLLVQLVEANSFSGKLTFALKK